jgi:hypothetical protein
MSGRQTGVVVSILLLCAGWLKSITPGKATPPESASATSTTTPTTSIPTTSLAPTTSLPPPPSTMTTTTPPTSVTSTTTSVPTTTITTTAPLGAVSPILECVDEEMDGTYTAHFGYLNSSDRSVTIPTGPDNRFTPPPLDRGQPSSFFFGRQKHVFTVSFDGSSLVWTVRSPDGSVWNAAASRESERCQ